MSEFSNYVLQEKKWDDLSLSLRMYGKNEPPEMQLENMYELVSRANGARFEEPRFDQSEFSHSDRMYPSMMKPDVKSRWDQQKRSYEQERDQYKEIKRFAHANFMSENPSHPLTQGLAKTSYGQQVSSEREQLMRQQSQQRQQNQQTRHNSGPQSGTGQSIHDEMQRDSVDLRGAKDQLVKFTSPETNEVFAALSTERNETGRIVNKAFASTESQHELNYKYDSEGRLITAYYSGKAVEVYAYNNQGQRTQSHVTGGKLSNYTYNQIGQLVQAGTTTYRYNSDGDLVEKNESGQITRYNYLETGQLCEVTLPDGTLIEYRFDENGLRTEKLINDKLYQRYQWTDLTTLAAVEDSTGMTRFQYNEDGDPIAMAKDEEVYLLATDQLGSIFTVADMVGNSLQEVLYDSFGRKIQNSNHDHDLYLGFSAGLHDKDTGLIHFGYREYDSAIGRFITPDTIGFAGGDIDVYGYCLDDPINFVDRTGLFRFGKRKLEGLSSKESKTGKIATAAMKKVIEATPIGKVSSHVIGANKDKINEVLDKKNLELKHEHGFYEDGSGDNIGLFKEGLGNKETTEGYKLEDKHYDDKRMRRSQKSTTSEEYNLCGVGGKKNNCQDYSDKLRKRYSELERGDKQR
ncbi:RHS repeat domain-containing protein [Maridesulfovibrio frigidus]|uniref:RHS repeat domain-containing protein n=1 Tax=Maridesulfovibrio frigidus TaxID=340956 RepID=UPI00068EBC22|nr:RHS repeat-associated core domain-containing protein [Maridesulfovibrio frigidus]